ncbi:hypothetical protein RRG08_005800 [Elysia crispata]|uniref:Uncharacterized protein n=1 Tax=Elysia crispata TaxID=231223 RepID=A0AAE0ZVR5_9GAST|nr:hypothetical protein RRG08_005800 [Elysia crispata]
MADVNINNLGTEDIIGDLFVEGLNNLKVKSSINHGSKDLVGPVYPGETLNFVAVVKMNPIIDLNLWKKCISLASGQANIHSLKASTPHKYKHDKDAHTKSMHEKGGEDAHEKASRDDLFEDIPEKKLTCPVVVTYTGTSSKSNQCIADLDLDISDFKESSCKPHFRDEKTYIIPLSVALENEQPSCQYLELHVVLWLYTIGVLTSRSSPEPDLHGTSFSSKGLFIQISDIDENVTHSKRTRIPVAHSEFFDVASDEDDAEAGKHQIAKDQIKNERDLHFKRTRIPVAHSEFFDVGSDEEATDAGTEKLVKQGITSGGTADNTELSASSCQKKDPTSDQSPLQVSSSSCYMQEKKATKFHEFDPHSIIVIKE